MSPASSQPRSPALRSPGTIAALTLAVGVVTADSSVVTLALPDILRELRTEVDQVAWVLIAYNLVLALAAVPAALLLRRGARVPTVAIAGLLLFAVASAACGVMGSLEALVAARVLQAIGGALVVTALLDLLVHASGSVPRGVAHWAAAGVAGAAIGPFAGGVLTETISWQAIFLIQVPLVLAALVAVRRVASQPAPASLHEAAGGDAHPGRVSHVATDLTLALLSAALTAALFLVVLLLIEGWRRTPIVAAFTVTVLPVAAILTRLLARRLVLDLRIAAATGAVLIAGGLVALGYLPDASLGWTLAPQIFVGIGIGLTIEALTELGLRGGGPIALRGGRNIAVRHLGIVAGLALLTPIFTADLRDAQAPARAAVVALVVEAPLPVGTKLTLATNLTESIGDDETRIPDLRPAFDATEIAPADRAAADTLLVALDDQLERAATEAFHRAFLVAGVLALLALLPLPLIRHTPTPTEPAPREPVVAA